MVSQIKFYRYSFSVIFNAEIYNRLSGPLLDPVPDLAQHVRRDARELARLEQDPIDVPPVEETLDVLRQVAELGLLQAALQTMQLVDQPLGLDRKPLLVGGQERREVRAQPEEVLKDVQDVHARRRDDAPRARADALLPQDLEAADVARGTIAIILDTIMYIFFFFSKKSCIKTPSIKANIYI